MTCFEVILREGFRPLDIHPSSFRGASRDGPSPRPAVVLKASLLPAPSVCSGASEDARERDVVARNDQSVHHQCSDDA